jgi:hypothetical protein
MRPAATELARVPLTHATDRALAELARLSGSAEIAGLSAAELLMERAWLMGARFAAGRSGSGRTRFVPARDGTLALAMPRPWDWELVPAWLETEPGESWRESESGWQALARATAQRPLERLVERGRLLGLALAPAGAPVAPPSSGHRHHPLRAAPAPAPDTRPLVLDLSALWAGPLCAHLLWLAGAEVVKVESTDRPDGAREGDPTFYALLNQGKRSVSLDLARAQERGHLRALIRAADIVIESSRPRALQQLDVHAQECVARHPGQVWISITGYGRQEPAANWIAFGDDAGVAGGLSDVMKAATGSYQFLADAVADPLTGVQAALAGWRAWQTGQGGLLELALSGVAAWCLAEETDWLTQPEVEARFRGWWDLARTGGPPPGYSPRPIRASVAASGQDRESVLRSLNGPC